MRLFRTSCFLPLIAFSLVLLISSLFYSSIISKDQIAKSTSSIRSSINKFIPRYAFQSSKKERESVPAFDYSTIPRKHHYAITSSVQTSSYTYIAMTLGYSLTKHNDLDSLDIDMVLLVRTEGEDAITPQNITNLQKVGWKIQVTEDLEFDGVNITDVRPWHRHNFNKLHLWTWTQYEKVVFIDADVICKNAVSDLFKMPGDLAATTDTWWDVLVDSKFNSGVLVLRPNVDEFRILSRAIADPDMHNPWEADQDFLNAFYKFRFFGLPFKYNFNLVMVQYHKKQWDMLWDEAVLVHMTVQKPRPDSKDWCLWENGCVDWEVLEYYYQVYTEMVEYYNFKDFPSLH